MQRLPVATIKIDKVFVDTLGAGECAIARNVVALAQSLSLTTVAEGVETEAQARTLVEMGCDHGQGYLHGRPVPGDQFALSLIAHTAPEASAPPVSPTPTATPTRASKPAR